MADRRQWMADPEEVLRTALDGLQARIWTAGPAIVDRFYPDRIVADVQPAIMQRILQRDGSTIVRALPLLVDCPVVFPGGGGFTLTFPVMKGDEVLVIIASRCIDLWWQQGGVRDQAELRMHDLSDGFVLVGPRSQPRVLAPAVAAGSAQLRSDDGALYVELAAGHVANIVAPGGLNITAAMTTITGNLQVTGNTVHTGQVSANGHIVDQRHTHGGVATGSGNTGAVA